MQKTPYVFPIVGGRKVEHLMDNIAALDVRLGPEHYRKIEGAVPFEVGFPTDLIVRSFLNWEIELCVRADGGGGAGVGVV